MKNRLTPWRKEYIYVRRDSEGAIAEVFDANPSMYLKVTDIALKSTRSVPSDAHKGGEKNKLTS